MTENVTVREALRKAIFMEMEANPDLFLMGENMHYGGSLFSKVISSEFHQTFGKDRVIDTPVSENGIAGAALGIALAGMKVIAEIYSADFLYAVGNEILNDIPKWRYQHRYKAPLNLVVRAPMGVHRAGGGGPEHSQCPEAFLHNSPGLTIVAPATPADAVGLLRSALRSGDPVLFLEHRQVYDIRGDVDFDSWFTVPLDRAEVVCEGSDLTVVAWGLMRWRAYEAIQELRKEGIRAALIDPRTIKPLDMEPVLKSAAETRRLMIVEEAPLTGSIASEIIARTAEQTEGVRFKRLTMPDIPYPYHPALEAKVIPSVRDIAEAAKAFVGAKVSQA